MWRPILCPMKNDPLKNQRSKVAAAEAALARARDVLRRAAKRKSLPLEGIFSESEFVLRTTADRWVREARSDVRADSNKALKIMLEALLAPQRSPFAHLAPHLAEPEPGQNQTPALPPTGKPALVVDNTSGRS
jgi:hypothetical protein